MRLASEGKVFEATVFRLSISACFAGCCWKGDEFATAVSFALRGKVSLLQLLRMPFSVKTVLGVEQSLVHVVESLFNLVRPNIDRRKAVHGILPQLEKVGLMGCELLPRHGYRVMRGTEDRADNGRHDADNRRDEPDRIPCVVCFRARRILSLCHSSPLRKRPTYGPCPRPFWDAKIEHENF